MIPVVVSAYSFYLSKLFQDSFVFISYGANNVKEIFCFVAPIYLNNLKSYLYMYHSILQLPLLVILMISTSLLYILVCQCLNIYLTICI